MLHNSGSCGSNDAPINMGTSVNGSQMTPPPNVGHNLSNLDKMSHQPAHMASTHFNLPDYPPYGHPQLAIGSHMHPFQSCGPMGYQPNYMIQNSSKYMHAMHENTWQSSLLPTNLSPQLNHTVNTLNQPISYEKSQECKEHITSKNYPLNIPQVPSKTFQKLDSDNNYGLFNANRDRFSNYSDSNWNAKMSEKPLIDNTRRKSLENTVRMIENILVNTVKQQEMHQNNQRVVTEHKSKSTKSLQDNVESEVEDTHKETQPKPSKTSTEPHEDVASLQSKASDDEDSIDSTEREPKLTNENTSKQEDTPKQTTESDVNVINSTQSSSDSENSCSESDLEITRPLAMENVVVKLENEEEQDPAVVIKVEPINWGDADYLYPFQCDVSATPREDAAGNIVDSCESVELATALIKSGNSDVSPNSTFYECPHCNIVINHVKRFLIHYKWHSFGLTNDKRMEMVKERDMRIKERREARVVDRMNSKEIKDATTAIKKVWPCKDCDKVFSSKGSLKNHRHRLHPTRPRPCKLCGVTLAGYAAVRAHARLHRAAAFQCRDCPKRFKHAHSLAKHRDTHLEKTVSCSHCTKMFGSVNQMKIHQKTHERARKETTYHCSYCGKGFHESYGLTAHERTHRNERPFQCEICSTSFGTNSSLKRHLKVSHNSAKPFACPTCKRSFISAAILERHVLRHHGAPGTLKYQCDLCPCRYIKQKELQRHMYKNHPKGKSKKEEDTEPSEKEDANK